MPAKTSPKAKSATVPRVVARPPANEPTPRKRKPVVTAPPPLAAKARVATAAEKRSGATSIAKAQSFKRVKYSVSMPPAEHDAILALKHKLSEIVGSKMKKSDIVRAGVLLLLSLPDSKIRAALGKISAINGTTMNDEHKK